MKRCIPLEPAAETVCNQSSVPPLIFQMPPEQGRRVLEEAQNTPVYKYPADISSDCINTGRWGSIPLYFIAPGSEKIRNIIFYIHGAGWVFGSFHTHEKLVRNALDQTNACRTAMDASTGWINRQNQESCYYGSDKSAGNRNKGCHCNSHY